MSLIVVQPNHIIDTLNELRAGGHANSERVVLWLGIRTGTNIEIREIFVPEQYAARDFFRIPKEAMAALLKHLRETRYFIAAQVHSHPELAFHSWVDDEWAIVRHAGALSLVIPYFGLQTECDTFIKDAAVFELSPNNKCSDGMKMFGVMDLNYELSGCRFSIGLRNSNDKSMRLALTAGYQVFVCDNMAFSGDFTPMFHKHTRSLELKDAISIAVDRIHRGFEPLKAQVEAMHEQGLTDEEVKLIIYQGFLERRVRGVPRHLLPMVHDYYFKPKHESFVPRNLWSLSNAFTSAFKKLAPTKQFEVTARLGAYLADIQKGLKFKQKLESNLSEDGGVRPDGQLLEAGQIRDDEFEENFFEENFDEDDAAEDPYEEFDEYFDSEAEEELIEEYERRTAA